MSEYIDAERLNMEWQTLKPFGVTDTMIENLKWIVDRQPTIEVSEDCIDRKKLLEQIDKDSEGSPGYYGDTWQFIKTIEDAPSVVPTVRKNRTVEQSSMVKERKRGKWTTKKFDLNMECSNCKALIWYSGRNNYKYCPNCGADMRGKDNE